MALPPPLEKTNISRNLQSPPPKIKVLQFCTATATPPPAGTSQRVQQVQAGLGLGLGVQGQAEMGLGVQGQAEMGLGVQGQGQAELRLGGQGVLRWLPDHSSLALLKNINFRYRPTTAPFTKLYKLTTASSRRPPKNNN